MIYKRLRSGYTLVEVLIGVFILSVGIVSILGAFPVGMRIVYKIKRTTLLCTFASSKAAEFQAYANPMGTLCYGEDGVSTETGAEVNPFVHIPGDSAHVTPGTQGDRVISEGTKYKDYGISAGHPKSPGGSNGHMKVPGGGKHLHWKISDFDTYIRCATYNGNFSSTAKYTPAGNDYYDTVTDNTHRMGLTQNERRHEDAYGFTRRYIIEVFDAPIPDAKTDTSSSYVYNAYYAFSTAVWNPHVFRSTEWSPVVYNRNRPEPHLQGQRWDPAGGSAVTDTRHDYFWKWLNEFEGWGGEQSNTIRYAGVLNDKKIDSFTWND